jgi:hypothetical protein
MNAGSIAGARPRLSRPSIAGPPRVVSNNNIAITSVGVNKNNNNDKNRQVRSNSISTVVTSNKMSNSSCNKKRQLHTISPTNKAATASATATTNVISSSNIDDIQRKRKMLQSIHPTDYAKAGFKANGYKDFDIIIQDSIKRFMIKPTQEMIDAYSTDIVTAVRTNNVDKARELYNKDGTTGSSKFKYGCNACNRFGESILHIACRRGHMDMVKFLIEEVGLRIDTIRDDYHRTPLHDAFWTPIASYDVVDFLLRQPNVVQLLLLKDVRGYTPLDYARSEDRGKWLRFLWERKYILRPTSLSTSCLSSTSTSTCTSTPPSLSNITSTSSTTKIPSTIVPSTSRSSATLKVDVDVDDDADTDTDTDDYDDDDDISVSTTSTTPDITTAVVIEQKLSTSSSVNNKRKQLCG